MNTNTIEHCGFVLEIAENDQVISVRNFPLLVRLGQEVESNGRFEIPAGTKGTVTRLFKPFDGRSDDFIQVDFGSTRKSIMMKFKDLVTLYDPEVKRS